MTPLREMESEMSVGLMRRIVAIGAAVGLAVTIGACSAATQASGQYDAGAGAPHSERPGPTAISAPTTPATQSTGAPVIVTAPPLTRASEGTDAESGAPGTETGGSTPGAGGAGQTTGATSGSSGNPGSTGNPGRAPAPAATVTGKPALGSTGVAPADDITISVRGGTLSWVTFTNPDGAPVKGALSQDRTRWTLGEPLGFGKTYTVTGVAVNADGVQTKIDGTYRTATTVEPVTTTISPGDGAVVGVAAPVIVKFGMDPQDKALIEKNMKVVTTPTVEGAWAWITHDGDTYPSLDWRPKAYWPAGTKVHVESNIYGLKFADGWYGGDDVAVDFTIGRNQVVIANAKTHRMTVQRNGKTVWTFDASLGMGDDPNGRYGLDKDLVTRSGIHVVMDKYPVYKMSNPKYGYRDVSEYWAVRISNNGEFIHNNPGTSAWNLANANVTHGCVNLAAGNAKKYYESAIYGDPVEVVGTSVKLGPSDGDIYDWAIDWPTWRSLSALS